VTDEKGLMQWMQAYYMSNIQLIQSPIATYISRFNTGVKVNPIYFEKQQWRHGDRIPLYSSFYDHSLSVTANGINQHSRFPDMIMACDPTTGYYECRH
jgi:hypothetical protein